ncbi:unnamed protein product [Macrosiphum euphorbiae]|uniref:MI domain-containing protein n=1 Tax=Macrosiphum euphorbiae TaxID=13131 RepID=A0AAV0X7T1_9HEMI|nr:unnamed protein product [Macrosiphum euphorbiae]
MSNAQTLHGQSLIMQSQPLDITPNIQRFQQVSQQPSTTPMQITEAYSQPVRKIVFKIIDPNTGREIDLNNSAQGPPALSIDTIERLEKTIDLVFEKAIEEKSFAHLCSILCSSMQLVEVSTKYGQTASFKKLIISKCQSLFELDKAQEMDAAKKLIEINSCKNPKKKKELQLEFEENERRLRKRSVGNCRFMGELFKQKILTPNIMLYCIVNLVTKHDEVSLECLCILLKTVGKELEQSYDLNDTFDKLTALTFSNMKSKISSRIQFMIQDVIDLRRHKFISEKQDRYRGGGYKSHRENKNGINVSQNNTKYKKQHYIIDQSNLQGFKENSPGGATLSPPKWSFTTGKNMTFTSSNSYSVLNDHKKPSNSPQIISNKTSTRKLQFPRSIPSINSSSSRPTKSIEEPVSELDSEIVNAINLKCLNLLYEYEQMQNLDDIIDSLLKDETSVIHTRYEAFVRSMSFISLDNSSTTQSTVAGKIFAELVSIQILSMDAIIRGIDAVLKDSNEYLIDYPNFFSHIAAIIAPILSSQNASFDFNNLKDFCTSIRPNTSSIFFTEVLNEFRSINSSSSRPKKSIEEPVSELDSEIVNAINLKCLNLLYEYEQMQNLDDIIDSLLKDETSVIHTRYEAFVRSMSFISLDNSSTTQSTVAGKIFAELVSIQILSMDAIIRGIDAVLKDSNEHLIDYPNFFSHIAAIIAPILSSQNASFDFNNLKDFCTSIRPNTSSIFFTEVLNEFRSINSSSSRPKKSIEEPVSELDSEIVNAINLKCLNLLYEYEQMQNLDDIIDSLLKDETSVIHTRYEAFVRSMSFISLDNSSTTQSTVAGKIFAELVSIQILSMDAIIRGIDAVLKDSNEHLIDYPNFFSHIAAIIAPILSSQNASFDFNNLKDFCTSIRPNTSSIFFNEVLNKIHSINSSSSRHKKSIEEPVSELDSEMANKINRKCKNILLEYEQMQNVDDIIYSLSEDKTSIICTRHEEFVTSMSIITLDSSPITRTLVAGNIFAELLSKKILSMDAITRGIDAVLKDWNDYLMVYPQLFSYIAAIIAPLLLTQDASFDFNNLKDSCTSIRPDNSSQFFTEVLNKILSSKETQNIKEQLDGILWIYNKWNASENVTLDAFMPNNQINKYLKKDQIGILILSIVIYDKMKLTNNKLLYNTLQSWICTNICEEIIKNPLFVKSLTIAIVIVCLKLNHSYEDFFDPVHLKLLSHFIEFEPLPVHEIQARQVQCMYGIQIMSATLKHPRGMVLKLFNKLYHHRVISKESFELFIQEYEEITEK